MKMGVPSRYMISKKKFNIHDSKPDSENELFIDYHPIESNCNCGEYGIYGTRNGLKFLADILRRLVNEDVDPGDEPEPISLREFGVLTDDSFDLVLKVID